MFKEKKGIEVTIENIIFIVLITIFFVVLFVFVTRAATGSAYYEQLYAKQIALLIDSAKPGMNIIIDLTKLTELAEKNKLENWGAKKTVNVDIEKQEVIVKASKKQYSFFYFNTEKFNIYYDDYKKTIKFQFLRQE